MSVISGGVDSKYVLLDGQERNIERSLSEIENKDITLTNGFLIETVGNSKLDDTGNTSGTTNENDLVNLGLVDLRIAEDLLNRLESAAKEILAKLLEAGTGEGGVEVDALEERVDFDRGLGGGGERTLGTLASGTETTESTWVRAQV